MTPGDAPRDSRRDATSPVVERALGNDDVTVARPISPTGDPVAPSDGDAEACRAAAALGSHRYQVLARWGGGGMADVYLARQLGSLGFDKVVALKLLRPELSSDPDFREMFLREARTAGLLSHPSIVQTFHAEEVGPYLFMAMEFVVGGTLQQLRQAVQKRGDELPVALAVEIVREIAVALDYAHHLRDHEGNSLDLVHRDVTPSNVMLTHQGGVKLLDFGIARLAAHASRTKAGVIKGNFAYMSPEQASALPVDGRSDIFSCGVMLWELLTGRRAFQGESEIAVLQAVVGSRLVRPSLAGADCHAQLDEIVFKATALDPTERYATAMDLANDLAAYRSAHHPGYSGARVIRQLMQEHFGERLAQYEELLRVGARSQNVVLPDRDSEHSPSRILEALPPPIPDLRGPRGSNQSSTTFQVRDADIIGLSDASRPRDVRRRRLAVVVGLSAALGTAAAVAWSLAPPASPAQRVLRVDSDPVGAEVCVDGQPVGMTPLTTRVAAAFPLDVTVQRRGYVAWHRHIERGPERAGVNARLERANVYGTVIVRTNPPGARVTVDGIVREGVTPVVVPGLWLGEPHQVSAELDGYQLHHDVVEFAESSTLTVRMDLSLVSPAYLTLQCVPSPCEAWIDGQLAGVTPATRLEVAALRSHEVSLRRGNSVLTTETLTLEPGETRVFVHRAERAVPVTSRGRTSVRPADAAVAPETEAPPAPPEATASSSEPVPSTEPSVVAADPAPPQPSTPRIQGIMERYLGPNAMKRRATMRSP